MRYIQRTEYFDVGQVFVDADEVDSFERLKYERYLTKHYKILCEAMDYLTDGAEIFPCKIKGY